VRGEAARMMPRPFFCPATLRLFIKHGYVNV
jgi:hypothetical protein